MDKKENNSKILIWFIVIAISFTSGFALSELTDIFNRSKDKSGYVLTGDLKNEYQGVNVNLLWEVWANINNEYISSDIEGQDLLYGAAKGLVAGLNDPYSTFLTPAEKEEYLNSNKGEFEGIGVTLTQQGEYVAVETPLAGGPGERAGLQNGDIILFVDKNDMYGKSLAEAVALIRGEAGTTVNMQLRRINGEEYDASIVREKIDTDNIVLEETEAGIYTIKIYKFTEETVEAFKAQWDEIINKIQAGDARGVIVDVRNNPGGFVSSVQYVLEEFLPQGAVIFQEEAKNGRKTQYKVSRTGRLLDLPIVVIVNGGSASASEIFAGAIQDHKRGLIIGQKTLGKGVEQRLIDLQDGSILQIVYQRWLTPKGRNITTSDPIHPDVEIEGFRKQEKEALKRITERN